ncbi:MAG: RNA polymerase sigma factor [Planctomycetes bacterium]|nr:RNA polymerase sigma factor [Planctomycetota bacterium]
MNEELRRTIEAVWRRESARVVAGLTRLVGDVERAEQLAQDAFVAALEQWPRDGVPDHPGAWWMAAAKRRAIDGLRRDKVAQRRLRELARAAAERQQAAAEAAGEPELGDEVLRLTFLCCHPVLPPESRTALTLRLLAGLTTEEIARAYLVPEATIAQRIVRAKRTLAERGIEFELPAGEALAPRLGSVLEVLYLVFNEGYTATSGDSWTRVDLCEEALRLGRVLAEQMPDEPEVHGLVGLMEIQSSRLGARRSALGDPLLLLEQDRTQWSRLLIDRGLAALARAAASEGAPGPYRLQAEIAACHARAASAQDTDWTRIVDLYGRLLSVAPSPIVELNRAVAVAMAFGPHAGLYLVDALAADSGLAGYHLLPSVRGELLRRLGRLDEARREFERAAVMTRNVEERGMLVRRAAACG